MQFPSNNKLMSTGGEAVGNTYDEMQRREKSQQANAGTKVSSHAILRYKLRNA
jgi:hypothetical protein